MNKHHYSKKAISTFEIIGSYFVDVFYNYLYLNADKTHRYSSGGKTTLTEEYINSVKAYIVGVSENAKYYQKTVIGVLEQYRTHTKYNTITLNDFINRTLEQFLPEEHFSVLTDTDKEFFFSKIITNTVNGFARKILKKEMLEMIIDDHMNEENTRFWLDEIVDIQVLERESLFNHFTKQTMRASGMGREQVDIEVVEKIREDRDKLWRQVQELLTIKCRLESELERAKKVSEVLYKKMSAKTPQAPSRTSPQALSRTSIKDPQTSPRVSPKEEVAKESIKIPVEETQAPPKRGVRKISYSLSEESPKESSPKKDSSKENSPRESPKETLEDEASESEEPANDDILVAPDEEVSEDDIDLTFLEGTSRTRRKD